MAPSVPERPPASVVKGGQVGVSTISKAVQHKPYARSKGRHPSLDFGALDVTRPHQFIRVGALDVIKQYKFIGYGALDDSKPYKFIGFGRRVGPPPLSDWPLPGGRTKPYEFIGFGAMDVTEPYEFYTVW